MEKKTFWMWIEIQKDEVWFLSHEISSFQERIFKILIIKDKLTPQDYQWTYKVFEIEQNYEPVWGTSYEIKKILKE